MSQKCSQVWGIENYEVPSKYLDHQKIVKDKENFAIAIGEKKPAKSEINKKAKRADLISEIEKKHKDLPEPWRYNIPLKWEKGYKDDFQLPVVSKNQQMNKYKWTNVPKENQIIEVSQKKVKFKIDISIKKHTFIEQIIDINTNKNYPLPSATDYFMDEKGIKKFYPQKVDLMLKKSENSKPVKDSLP